MGHSFDEAFAAEFAPLHRYLARRVGAAAADELAAETFTVAFRRWDRLDPERPVRPWAGTVKSRLSRTREKLRNRLEPVGQEAV